MAAGSSLKVRKKATEAAAAAVEAMISADGNQTETETETYFGASAVPLPVPLDHIALQSLAAIRPPQGQPTQRKKLEKAGI